MLYTSDFVLALVIIVSHIIILFSICKLSIKYAKINASRGKQGDRHLAQLI